MFLIVFTDTTVIFILYLTLVVLYFALYFTVEIERKYKKPKACLILQEQLKEMGEHVARLQNMLKSERAKVSCANVKLTRRLQF